MVIASTVSILAFFGLFGEYAEAFSTFIADGLSLTLCPLIAWLTEGKYYLARPNPVNGPDVDVADITATHLCAVCETAYELPDIADCPVRSGPICSLCCSLDAECGDVCRKEPSCGPVLLPHACDEFDACDACGGLREGARQRFRGRIRKAAPPPVWLDAYLFV